jgi:hypothetical protein
MKSLNRNEVKVRRAATDRVTLDLVQLHVVAHTINDQSDRKFSVRFVIERVANFAVINNDRKRGVETLSVNNGGKLARCTESTRIGGSKGSSKLGYKGDLGHDNSSRSYGLRWQAKHLPRCREDVKA